MPELDPDHFFQSELGVRTRPAPQIPNPRWLFFIGFLGLIPVSIILLAFNWKRLHKPFWTSVTLFLLLLNAALLVGAGAVVLKLDAGVWWRWLPLILAGLLSFGLWAGLNELQRGAYRAWRATGDIQSAWNYRYPLGFVMLRSLVFVLGLAAVATLTIFLVRPHEQQFANHMFSVTYRSPWQAVNPSEQSYCQEVAGCALYLVRVAGSALVVNEMIFVESFSTESAATVRDRVWQQVSRNQTNAQLQRQGMVQIDGKMGYTNEYSIPQATGEAWYVMEIYLVEDARGLFITIAARSRVVFLQEHDEIEQILTSIRFPLEAETAP